MCCRELLGEVDVDFYGGQQPSSAAHLPAPPACGAPSASSRGRTRSSRSAGVAARRERSRAPRLGGHPRLRHRRQPVAVVAAVSRDPGGGIHPAASRSRWACWPRRPDCAGALQHPARLGGAEAVAPTCRRGCGSPGVPSTIRARSRSAATWDGSPRPTRCSIARRHGGRARQGRPVELLAEGVQRKGAGGDWAAVGSARAGADRQEVRTRAAGVRSTSAQTRGDGRRRLRHRRSRRPRSVRRARQPAGPAQELRVEGTWISAPRAAGVRIEFRRLETTSAYAGSFTLDHVIRCDTRRAQSSVVLGRSSSGPRRRALTGIPGQMMMP